MGKLVALIIEGIRGVHADQAGGGNYATLCGQSGDDDGDTGTIVPVERGDKIDCDKCTAIIRAAKHYRETDIRK